MMNISPELTLDLTGYADRRGDSGYNQALSEQRLVEVKNYIESQGVRNSVYKGKLMMPQLYSMKHRMLKVTFLIAA
ncbi:OmpA family protein [Shewanella intestini]|uniref:OmpA family protein n=2 Tax=Shewanellaceae TaxID=267890 RepID=A0ABS5I147_9GAMM|nr:MULTISPECIES: OmpA family protein [Shewanella]MBR9727748.1 OmpA family protein [Shewanella intestini]MRG36259.1 OmpA family protein [Shewanella sp. XMDDZSB0408]